MSKTQEYFNFLALPDLQLTPLPPPPPVQPPPAPPPSLTSNAITIDDDGVISYDTTVGTKVRVNGDSAAITIARGEGSTQQINLDGFSNQTSVRASLKTTIYK